MYGGDEVSAVVLDMGSSTTRVGYAGEDSPKFVLPSAVGVPLDDDDHKRPLVGTSHLAGRCDNLRLDTPMADGVVANWDAAEALIDHAYKSCVAAEPAEHPLLMAEPSFNPAANREKTAELLFEKFGVPAFFLCKNAALSAFAAGRGTALVLDVGGGTTTATAVHEGYVLSKSLQRSVFTADMLTEMLLRSLEARDPPQAVHPIYCVKRAGEGVTVQAPSAKTHASYHRYMQLQTLRDAKENVCRCAYYPPSEATPIDTSPWAYEMPDRTSVDFAWERLHLPELYLTPDVLKSGSDARAAKLASLVPEGTIALPDMIYECIRACDTDVRRELWGNVVFSGGGTLLPGLTERLQARLGEMVPQMSMKVKIHSAPTPAERRFATWIGGSVLASLGFFQQLWMSKAEYDEQGAAGIHRKCP